MKMLRSLFAAICAVALTTASVYAQKNDPNWAVYNPPNPKVVYTWLNLDRSFPYSNANAILDADILLRLPTLYRRDYKALPSGTRLPIHIAPDVQDLAKARWKVWRFGQFVADGIKVPTIEQLLESRTRQLRAVTYRPLPTLRSGDPIPHRVDGLRYGEMRIPVLNYSPDMITGYPCPPEGEPREAAGELPRVWLEVGDPRATGAALVPDDPCVTQRAIDLAVYALSHASPDQSMSEFMNGLRTIRDRSVSGIYGYSDTDAIYRMYYLEKDTIAWFGKDAPLHGGLMHFTPNPQNKRLYWLLVHPPGDPRLHPVSHPFDAYVLAAEAGTAKQGSPYWRVQHLTTKSKRLVGPWIGRIGVRFVLYSPDEALVCGRSVPHSAIAFGKQIEGNRRERAARKEIDEFFAVRCEFAVGPHTRLGTSHLTSAVVYLVWDFEHNAWTFDEITVGSAEWGMTAGIDRVFYPASSVEEANSRLMPASLVHRLLPSFVAIGR